MSISYTQTLSAAVQLNISYREYTDIVENTPYEEFLYGFYGYSAKESSIILLPNRRANNIVSLDDEIDNEKPFVGIVDEKLLKVLKENLEKDSIYIPFFKFLKDNGLEYNVVVGYFKFNDHQ